MQHVQPSSEDLVARIHPLPPFGSNSSQPAARMAACMTQHGQWESLPKARWKPKAICVCASNVDCQTHFKSSAFKLMQDSWKSMEKYLHVDCMFLQVF